MTMNMSGRVYDLGKTVLLVTVIDFTTMNLIYPVVNSYAPKICSQYAPVTIQADMIKFSLKNPLHQSKGIVTIPIQLKWLKRVYILAN